MGIFTPSLQTHRGHPMTAFNEQAQQQIAQFDLQLQPGSVKTIMAGIKAAYEPQEEKKGAVKPLSLIHI